MAIFHLAAKVVSRKAGQSVVAKAAYNAREELTEERTGEVKDYSRAEGLIFSGIYTPANAPQWAHDRAQLWNKADQAEKRKDATLAREYELALPHELTNEQRRFLVQDFVRESFTRKGYAVDVCIHAPDREGDERNYHAHILVTDRRLEADGFAADKKERKLKSPDRKAELEAIREKWERIANRHLERHGHEARIDRRSLKDQGIDREPTEHLGPYATQLERDGEESERGNTNRDIEARNKELEAAQREYESALAEREQWEERVNQAGIQKAEEEQKKEREAKRDEAKNAELGKTAADIRLAATLSPSGESFSAALKERCLVLSQISKQEAATLADELGHGAPHYNAGEVVIINQFGGIHRLTERTTGKTREELDKYLIQIKRENLPNAEQGKKEAVLMAQYKQRAELMAKQAREKAELEKQQAEQRQQREKQRRDYEEGIKQQIDADLATRQFFDKNRLEKRLKENHFSLFGEAAERVKQYIGHKIEEHKAEKRKENLHKAGIEKDWREIERDQDRAARQDKAHERGGATLEIKQAETREKAGIKAPERDEALEAARRFFKTLEQEKQAQGAGWPDQKKVADAERERNTPKPPKERGNGWIDELERNTREGGKIVSRGAKRTLRVIDKTTGVSSGLSNGVASILDGIASTAEAAIDGLAGLFGAPPTPPDRPAPPTAGQREAARKALRNIQRDIQRGDDIDAADLRNLPPAHLERIREGGDEALQNLVRRFEREERERREEGGRER